MASGAIDDESEFWDLNLSLDDRVPVPSTLVPLLGGVSMVHRVVATARREILLRTGGVEKAEAL